MLIVGLGNPGKQYEMTRHNIGFMVLDKLSANLGFEWREQFRGMYASETVAGVKCHFLKPYTYMNLSGEAVGELCRYYKIDPENVYVAHDELDFPYGIMKLSLGGSAGGHNGIKSLIQHLDGDRFLRFRMGVAGIHRSEIRGYTADYVLAPFTSVERETLDSFVSFGAEALVYALKEGFRPAMNRYNRLARETERKAKEAEMEKVEKSNK